MSDDILICFNKSNCSKPPCDTNDKDALLAFRKDNPHILSNTIPHGTPFVVRQMKPTQDRKPWQQLYPQKARQLRELRLLPRQQRVNIADMLNQFGSDLVTAMAEFNQEHIAPLVFHDKIDPRKTGNQAGYSGAAATVIEQRFNTFGATAERYQKALEAVRRGKLAKLSKIEMTKLEQAAKSMHAELTRKFHREINKYASKASSRGNAWTRAQRGINQAKSARSFQPIKLSTTKEFNLIKGFASKTSMLGYGALAIDAGVRGAGVYDQYKAGANWQKSAAVETAAFGSAAAAGMAVGSVVTSTLLGIALFSTPVGWVVAVGIGVTAGYGAAVTGDTVGRFFAESAYKLGSSI
ncbi:hypothetical protein [Agarivorans aestuarii]|uniref:hypothetical protein n=1 Tax=Agarivorans aestuarii TaxID=1563703 RepID=UPI001C814180|nr:hypothetical protein [Agarivorans aestuarii]